MLTLALALVLVADAKDERAERATTVIKASQPRPEYDDFVRDLLDELSRLLAERLHDAPVAVLEPTVSGLAPEAGRRLRIGVERALKKADIDEAFCDPCADAAFVRGDVIASGDLASLAERVGARVFLKTHLDWQRTRLLLSVSLVDASGKLVWAETLESDEARAALLERGLQTPQLYAKEMSAHLPKKTSFGLAAIAGLLRMPFKVEALGLVQKGDINGIMFAFRFYEAFGLDKSFIVGAEARGFIDTEFQRNLPPGALDEGLTLPASGGMFTGIVGWSPQLTADLRVPRFRIGAEVGVFLGGSLGNNVVGGGIIELMLVSRFGLNLALLYVGESKSVIGPVTVTIGGFTWAAGGSFNWD